MLASLAKKPQSKLSLFYREHKELLDWLAPSASTPVRCCAAKLINYFHRWESWKATKYPTRWIYQPLTQIRNDLINEHSIHVIRSAIALLEELGFLKRRKNLRDSNFRNGQDRTWQYRLCSDFILAKLEQYFKEEAQTLEISPFVNSESPTFGSESPAFTVERYTHISTSDSCTDSSLLEREEADFVQDEDPWTVDDDEEVEQEVLASFSNPQEISQKQEDSGEDHFSAPTEPKLTKMVEDNTSPSPEPKCSEVVQDDLKPLPKLKSDRPSGFHSDAERDGFYQALLELGKTQGKKSPVSWSFTIIKSIDAGEPCHYLSEYREGQQVGSFEKQEWEVAPGQVFPGFISYLTARLKKAGHTDEQAITAAHQQLKDVNLARSLWESCKRYIAKYSDDWEKQKQLGVQNAYVPPELLPQREVSSEQVGSMIASLQSGCVQLQLAESATAEEKPAELEPTKEKLSDPEPEIVTPQWLQQRLDSSPAQASLARTLARKFGYCIEEGLVFPAEGMPSVDNLRSLLTNPLTAPNVKRLIDAHPEWGFLIEAGEIHDF